MNPGCVSTFIVATAAAVLNGFPPNVQACDPTPNPDATSSVHPMAPMGTPLPSPLARVMMSGVIP